jgi:uncharacterized OB-fold protein
MENQFTHTNYSNFLNEHRLMGTRDTTTGQTFLPPRPVNPGNYSTEMEWYEFGGRGVLQAFSIVYIGPAAMIAAGYDRKNPYCVGIVKTEEGPMISALILGVDPCQPETIKIGTPLQVKFVDRGEGESKKTSLAFEVV